MDSFFENEPDNSVLSGVLPGSTINNERPIASHLQFLEENNAIVNVSKAIFEDFHRSVYSEPDLRDILQGFYESCDFAAKTIDKFSNEKFQMDRNGKLILNQLTLERNAYDLMLKLMDSEKIVSTLEKTLLHWSEDIASKKPEGFSQAIIEIDLLKSLNDIYANSLMRGKNVHVDSRFVNSDMDRDDEESCNRLNKILLGLLRCGRLVEAKQLCSDLGIVSWGVFLYIREFANNPNLTPLDSRDENFHLAKSRMFFKQTARQFIPMNDEKIQTIDQCIWATLSGSLYPLLAHVSTIEDRLWSYLSCGTETLLDRSLFKLHSKDNEQLTLVRRDLQEDIPIDIRSIFDELQNFENNPYYCLFGYLACDDWLGLLKYLETYVLSAKNNLPAHELRFFAHLVLIYQKFYKNTQNKETEKLAEPICDLLISKFADVLIEMKLYNFVSCYLVNLTPKLSKKKMINFLEGIQNESEQKEVLNQALSVGFQIGELCRDVYLRFKYRNPLTGDNNETAKAANEMIRCWKWLNFGGIETAEDSLFEANYLLRKLCLHNRMVEAMEFMKVATPNLADNVVKTIQQGISSGNSRLANLPDKFEEAVFEFECYVLYFEAISRYQEWQKHVEGTQAPQIPSKLSDEKWARLDLKRRAEYEHRINTARVELKKYLDLSEVLQKKSVKVFERILCLPQGWLSCAERDEKSVDKEIQERALDLSKIREDYLFFVIRSLIDVFEKTEHPLEVLRIATLIANPKYKFQNVFSKNNLRRLLNLISRSGAALLT